MRSYAVTLSQPQRATRHLAHFLYMLHRLRILRITKSGAPGTSFFLSFFSSYTAKNIHLTSRDLHFHLLLKAPAARKTAFPKSASPLLDSVAFAHGRLVNLTFTKKTKLELVFFKNSFCSVGSKKPRHSVKQLPLFFPSPPCWTNIHSLGTTG